MRSHKSAIDTQPGPCQNVEEPVSDATSGLTRALAAGETGKWSCDVHGQGPCRRRQATGADVERGRVLAAVDAARLAAGIRGGAALRIAGQSRTPGQAGVVPAAAVALGVCARRRETSSGAARAVSALRAGATG